MKEIFGKETGLDPRSYNSLISALEKANLPGFDYLEFKQSLAKLKKLGMDEQTAMQSAFTTASTMGLTKEKLLTTAMHYKTVLGKELMSFDKVCDQQIEKRVTGKKKEIETLQAEIEKHRNEIAKLEQKITESQRIIDSADTDVKTAMEKIKQTKTAFDRTFQSVMNQIEKDISNIGSII